RALELERADAVVRALEDVVGAPDVPEVPRVVPVRRIRGAVVLAAQHDRVALGVAVVSRHHGSGARLQVDRDLALLGPPSVLVEERDLVAGERAAHRPGPHRLPGAVADLARRLRLSVAVTDRDAPRLLDLRDDLRIERLAGADELAQRHRMGPEVLEHEHAP